MIRTILIDDEEAALNALAQKIKMYCREIEVIGASSSPKEGLAMISSMEPDLVFLDIEMPWMNGFELLKCLGEKLDFKVVFVTAYDQYAIQAFKVKAVDYLLKPVAKDDLVECEEKVSTHIQNFKSDQLSELMQEMEKPLQSKKVMIYASDGIEILSMEDINYCEASSNYTYVYTLEGRKIVASKTLSDFEKLLDKNSFCRVHKSFLVNLNYVQKLSTSEGNILVLKSGANIPVSRRKKEIVLNAISNIS